jgi:hypothetical protein
MLDPEGLKSLGISSVGQRLCILKRVYLLKLAQDIPIDPEHYVPPCRPPFAFSFPHCAYIAHIPAAASKEQVQQKVTLEELHGIVADQGLFPYCSCVDVTLPCRTRCTSPRP